jgi:hypothetical protein
MFMQFILIVRNSPGVALFNLKMLMHEDMFSVSFYFCIISMISCTYLKSVNT